jgi:hypothetical protein
MTKIVQPWWSRAWKDIEVKPRQEAVEGLADGDGRNRLVLSERKHGGIRVKRSTVLFAESDIFAYPLGHARAERNKAAFTKFRLPNEQKTTIKIDIFSAQA